MFDVFCDNECVIKNTTKVELSLNKKHYSIAHHFGRLNVAAGVYIISWIPSGENLNLKSSFNNFKRANQQSIYMEIFGSVRLICM